MMAYFALAAHLLVLPLCAIKIAIVGCCSLAAPQDANVEARALINLFKIGR